MIAESHLSVLNFRLIRDELRQTAKRKKIRPGKKLRPTLLTTYDQIVSRSMIMPTKEIERQANLQGMDNLFVLTTHSIHWFRERGFDPVELDQLPLEKQELYNLQRRSKILMKRL